MRIGISTFHRAYNCGAVLQAWALANILGQMGHDVSFPDCNAVGEISPWPELWRPSVLGKLRNFLGWLVSLVRTRFLPFVTRRRYRKFIDAHLRHVPCTVAELPRRYDLLVVGSDQVWSERCAGSELPLFLGETVAPSLPLVGYSVSIGDRPLPEAAVRRLRDALARRFRRVSFREEALARQLASDEPVTCDPTLLLDAAEYAPVACPQRLEKGDYVFLYGVSDVGVVWPAALRLARAKGLRLVAVGFVSHELCREKGVRVIPSAAPDVFLAYLRDAKFVVASSFHGCVFSILFGKRFLNLYGEETKGEDGRQAHLLRELGLLGHRLPVAASDAAMLRAWDLDYDVSARLAEMRTKSLAYLRDAIG